MPETVRLHFAPWVVLAACGAPSVRPEGPVSTPCSTERIGGVYVTGASPSAVPALTVLEGTLDDPSRTARIVQAATEALQWRGYAKAQITVTREARCFVDLRVAVVLGPKYKIARIAFRTEDELPRAQRLAALEDSLGTVNTIGGVLIEYRLRRALDGLAKRYRDAGWLDVEIGEPVFEYTGNSANVTIPIVAGERYRVRTIRAIAAKASVREKLLAEFGIEPGEYYDAPAVRRALERARRAVDRRVKLRTSAIENEHAIELEAILENP